MGRVSARHPAGPLSGDWRVAYEGHGDYRVEVTAADSSGNAARDAVTFHVDRVAPAVALREITA